MIVAAAVCPHPPLLLPGLTGATDVAAGLRRHCVDAVAALLAARPDRVVVVGGSDGTREHGATSPVLTSSFRGAAPAAGPQPPLSLAVGRVLLEAGGWTGSLALQAVMTTSTPAECASLGAGLASASGRTALLVMGDGSARRSVKAPGYVDERALPFDSVVVQALRDGDAAALARLDAEVAADLLVQGRAAWQVLAGAVDGQDVDARLLHADDPFGVLYLVATWLPRVVPLPRVAPMPGG